MRVKENGQAGRAPAAGYGSVRANEAEVGNAAFALRRELDLHSPAGRDSLLRRVEVREVDVVDVIADCGILDVGDGDGRVALTVEQNLIDATADAGRWRAA